MNVRGVLVNVALGSPDFAKPRVKASACCGPTLERSLEVYICDGHLFVSSKGIQGKIRIIDRFTENKGFFAKTPNSVSVLPTNLYL